MKSEPLGFGEELHRLRTQSGISLRYLADELGCTFLYLSEVECGLRKLPRLNLYEHLLKLIHAFDKADFMDALAAKSKPKLYLDTRDLSDQRALLAIQFNRKLHRLPDEAVKCIEALLASAG